MSLWRKMPAGRVAGKAGFSGGGYSSGMKCPLSLANSFQFPIFPPRSILPRHQRRNHLGFHSDGLHDCDAHYSGSVLHRLREMPEKARIFNKCLEKTKTKSFSFVFNNSGGFFVVLKVRGVFWIENLMGKWEDGKSSTWIILTYF